MTPEQRQAMIRRIALLLLQEDVPGAPSGAIGPPSKWWVTAEGIVDNVSPYYREIFA